MSDDFPVEGVEVTLLLVASDIERSRSFYVDVLGATLDFLAPPIDRGGEIRAFFRDPDGHLIEISELT